MKQNTSQIKAIFGDFSIRIAKFTICILKLFWDYLLLNLAGD